VNIASIILNDIVKHNISGFLFSELTFLLFVQFWSLVWFSSLLSLLGFHNVQAMIWT